MGKVNLEYETQLNEDISIEIDNESISIKKHGKTTVFDHDQFDLIRLEFLKYQKGLEFFEY